MKLIILSTILTLATAQLAQADIMGVGQKVTRVEVSQGQSTSVYDGNGNKVDYSALFGPNGYSKRNISSLYLGESFGIGSNSQIDLNLIYSTLDLGTTTVGGVSEVGARYLYQAFTNEMFNVNVGFGFRAPAENRADSFTSLSDNLTKFDYNLDLGYNVIPSFKLGLNTRFTDRNSQIAKSQTLFELYGAYFPTSSVLVSLSYLAANTSGGPDVLSPGAPFGYINESYNAVSATVGYKVCDMVSVDARYGQKLTSNIKNTDANTTTALGLTISY